MAGMILSLISIWIHPLSQNLARPHSMSSTLYSGCFSTSYLSLWLSMNFCNETLEPELYYILKLGILGFGQAQVPTWKESWRTGGKSSGKNVPRNPLHSPPENLLNIWLVVSFIGLILGTEKRKDRRTPTGLCNSYWGSADSTFGTCWGVASPESLNCAPCLPPVRRRFEETRNKRL